MDPTRAFHLRPPLPAPRPAAARPFQVGANLPWLQYGGDFGANAWSPRGGLARPERAASSLEAVKPSRVADPTRERFRLP